MRFVRRWLVALSMSASAIGAVEARADTVVRVALEHGDRAGVGNDPSMLALDADAEPSTLYSFAREGRYRSLPYAITQSPAALIVALDASVPHGTAVRVHVRTRGQSRWQPWQEVEPSGKLNLSARAYAVQVRLILLSDGDASPNVKGISIAFEGYLLQAYRVLTAPTYRVFATREGLVGHRTANGHRIIPRDRFVALPSWRVLNDQDEREYQVRVSYRGRSVVLPVWDVGPWNTRDDYWSANREMWKDLPRGVPQAQAAVQQGYNGGLDQFGRRPNLPNGIDIADGAFWDDLGLKNHAWVEVTFLWLEDAPGTAAEPESMPAAPEPQAVNFRDSKDQAAPIAVILSVVEIRPGHYFLRWYGRDEGSGVASYDVQVRYGASDNWRALLSGEVEEEVLFKTSSKGPAPTFRVRARDEAGNVGPFSVPFGPTTIKARF